MPPKDKDYFDFLIHISQKYGKEYVYEDFVNIFDQTNKNIDPNVLDMITEIARQRYCEDSLEVDIQFTIIYMTMIAEENKERTKLGKRIKRLGVYSALFENKTSEDASNFLRGMCWREIDILCKDRGF